MRQVKFFVALLCLIASGCRLWHTGDDPSGRLLSPDLLQALGSQLAHGSWQANPDWSLLEPRWCRDNFTPAEMPSRWTFSGTDVAETVSDLDRLDEEAEAGRSSAESATPGGKRENWNGFWPLSVSEVLEGIDARAVSRNDRLDQTGPTLGDRYLLKLAEEDSLPGWNAAILLVRRNPVAGRAAKAVLGRLVSAPPSFDPETKQAVGSPAIRRSRAAAGDAASQHPSFSGSRRAPMPAGGHSAGKPSASRSAADAARQTARQSIQHLLEQETTEEDAEQKRAAGGLEKLQELIERLAGGDPPAHAPPSPKPQRISSSMQAAAAEAWCRVLAATPGDPLEAMAPAGRVLERSDIPDSVRAELFRGVARAVPPAIIPRLQNAFRVSGDGRRVPVELRRAAIDACLIHALRRFSRDRGERPLRSRLNASHGGDVALRAGYDPSLWPSNVLDCRNDPDKHVRSAFGRWAALARYARQKPGSEADAFQILSAQLRDTSVPVRESALVSLGVLGSEAARSELRQQLKQPEERIRAAAVQGLAFWGPNEIASALEDPSSRVRQVAAEESARHPEIETALQLRKVLSDRDPRVQRAVVASIEPWPDELAVPLLLHGLQESARRARHDCLRQLRQRTGIDTVLPAIDSPHRRERSEAVRALAVELDLPLGFLDRMRRQTAGQEASADHVKVADITADLQVVTDGGRRPSSTEYREALERLKHLEAADVRVIEQFLQEHGEGGAGVLFDEVLPQLSPAYRSLKLLKEANVDERRRAARSLKAASEKGSLSPLVVRRLRGHLNNRQDILVWREAMAAVMPDASQENAQIALLALNDERPEVRLLGCEYVARHRRPEHAGWLMKLRLFYDEDKRVRLAAIEAAGRCRNPIVLDDLPGSVFGEPDASASGVLPAGSRLRRADGLANRKPIRGLRSLLTDADFDVRFATVLSLCQLGDGQATRELLRMSRDPDVDRRKRVIQAMGQSGRARFIEPLIRLGWTERAVEVRRAILNSLQELTLPGQRPAGLVDETDYDAKIRLWIDWWESRHGSPGSEQTNGESRSRSSPRSG